MEQTQGSQKPSAGTEGMRDFDRLREIESLLKECGLAYLPKHHRIKIMHFEFFLWSKWQRLLQAGILILGLLVVTKSQSVPWSNFFPSISSYWGWAIIIGILVCYAPLLYRAPAIYFSRVRIKELEIEIAGLRKKLFKSAAFFGWNELKLAKLPLDKTLTEAFVSGQFKPSEDFFVSLDGKEVLNDLFSSKATLRPYFRVFLGNALYISIGTPSTRDGFECNFEYHNMPFKQLKKELKRVQYRFGNY